MIHLHDARKLHFDLRLQWRGELLCWAIPKGPSLDPSEKRLAVQTENHPVEYKAFEGVIPEKSYGAGPSLIWDAGLWRPLGNVQSSLKKGHLRFYLKGQRLHGIWNLIRLKKNSSSKSQWLLVKENDKYADKKINPQKWTSSVATGRSLEDLKEESALQREVKQKLPSSAFPKPFSPQLATLTVSPPAGVKKWLIEKKYDGYRLLIQKRGEQVSLTTRNAKDWSKKVPQLVKEIEKLPVENIILDGELVAFKPRSRNESFQILQNFLRDEEEVDLKYFVFDILYLDEFDLRSQPQWERREILKSLFSRLSVSNVKLSETYKWTDTLLGKVCSQGREGLILKDPDSPYLSKRSSNWLKLKCNQREEFLVVGWTDPKGQRPFLGSLLLAEEVEGDLEYRGKVGTGFNRSQLKRIHSQLSKFSTSQCPLKNCEGLSGAHWLEPHYYAEIHYTERSRDKKLRHPVFLGLREDKFFKAKSPSSKKKASFADSSAMVGLTHPDRILFEEMNISKLDLARYYSSVFAHFAKLGLRRPLSLVRCPKGAGEKCFFQRHMEGSTDSPPQVKIQLKGKTGLFPYLEEYKDLLALIQLGTLEIHGWNCGIKDSLHPQYVVWDLDPAPGVAFKRVTQTAHLINLVLKEQSFSSYVRTTGGKGLHVLTAVENMSWDQAKDFSKKVSTLIMESAPDLYLIEASKKKRKGKIFIDYLRNSRSATSILNFSTRAKPGAPVAVPLFWEEVNESLDPEQWNLKTVSERLKKLKKDPWEEFFKQLR